MPEPAALEGTVALEAPEAGESAELTPDNRALSVRSNTVSPERAAPSGPAVGAEAAGGVQSSVTPVATATPPPSGLQGQIVGGEKAAPGAWPWMVAIQAFTEPGYHTFCGASLVAPSWALTAAHCVVNASPDDIVATVGPHRLDSGQGQKRSVDRIVVHPRYGFDFAHDFAHDLALLHLTEPADAELVPLLGADSLALAGPGTLGTVIGWGALSEDGSAGSGVL